MNIGQFKDKTTETIVRPMIEFIEEWGAVGYTREDAQTCGALIFTYLDALSGMDAPTNEAIMEQIKILVLALNDLNKATDYSLIETEAREAIWEVIQTSAVACGLQDAPDDVTEEWRDW